jgi:signal transduction histidine kinase
MPVLEDGRSAAGGGVSPAVFLLVAGEARIAFANERTTDVLALDAAARRARRNIDTDGATLEGRSARRIRADESRLRQLLENLFRNAIEHASSDNGGLTVTVCDLGDGCYVAGAASGGARFEFVGVDVVD